MAKQIPTLVMLILLSSFIIPVFSANVFSSVTAQSTNSCSNPSSSVLRLTAFGGVPSGFNMVSSAPSQSNYIVIRLMYTGISPYVFTNGTQDFSNSLTDWISHNANYTQWEFNVKPGLQWSNGQNVTAQDILNTYSSKFAFNATVDFLNLHAEVSSQYALNSSTAVFVLNQSDAHFAENAGQNVYTSVYPSSFVENGPSYSGINGTLVGVGPFYVSNYSAGETQMVLLRNPYYKPLPAACEAIISFVESDSQVPTYLIGGSTDYGPIEAGAAASVLANPHIHIFDAKAVDNIFLAYNITAYPYSSLAFRQALAYGINESEIASQAYRGYDTPATSSEGGVPPESNLWYSSNQQSYGYNTTEALALLNSMGIKKGSDGFLQYSNGTDISLTLFADNSYAETTLSSGIVQNNLQALGFKISLISSPLPSLIGDSFTNTNGFDHSMVMFQSGGPVFGIPFLDAQPSWNVYSPMAPYPTWLTPTSAEANYQGNLSIIKTTDNASQTYSALANIQGLNAANLPDIILGYPDVIFAYSTQNWVNWPSFTIYGLQSAYNDQGFALLQPASSVTTTASSVTTAASSLATSSSSTNSGATGTQATTSSASLLTTTTSTSNNTTLYAGIAVVVIIIVVALAAMMMRRKPSTSSA
ncbi:MAG: ABC transporter substrate-binding protein [Nitrososphaerales archaeon]